MRRLRTRWAAMRAAWRRIPIVDRGLMLFMAVLLAQSAYTMLFAVAENTAAENIDVVVRTSAAAIFGYFLSASFVTREAGVSPPAASGHILEMADGGDGGTEPQGKIGFVSDASDRTGGGMQTRMMPDSRQGGSRLQAAVATGIGLFSLVVLMVVRNSAQLDAAAAQSVTVTATVAQFRDFVSACVGYLIGCPAGTADPPA